MGAIVRKSVGYLSVLCWAASVSACTGDSGVPGRYAVRDSAGIEIVSNFIAGGWSLEEVPQFVEELRIGTVDGDSLYQFGQISGLDVDENGDVYVLDSQARHVRVFDEAGTFLRTIGRSGQGPGEFRTPLMLAVLQDGLHVFDLGNRRIQRFDRDGHDQGTVPIVLEDGLSVPFRRLPDNQILRLWGPVLATPGDGQNDLLVRETIEGAVIDTVLTLPSILSRPRNPRNAPVPVWTVAKENVLLATSSEFRIEERSLEGDVLRIITLDVVPSPIPSATQEEMLAALPEILRTDATIYPEYPVISSIMEGPEGTIWVEGPVVNETESEPSDKWYVFDASGRYLGLLETPIGFSPSAMRNDRFYGTQKDDLGVQYVVRLRVDGF